MLAYPYLHSAADLQRQFFILTSVGDRIFKSSICILTGLGCGKSLIPLLERVSP